MVLQCVGSDCFKKAGIAALVIMVPAALSVTGAVLLTTHDSRSLQRAHINIEKPTLNIILAIFTFFCSLWTFFSILFCIGIAKDKAGLVLAYFSYGVFMVIVIQLSALLSLLQYFWKLAGAQFGFSVSYISFLRAVYTSYDCMQQKLRCGSQQNLVIDSE